MHVLKIEWDSKTNRFVESVVARDLPPLLARARAKVLNDARDTGNEDVDETSMVSYVAKTL